MSQYNYTQLNSQKDIHYITLLPQKTEFNVSCFVSDDCCSALFNASDGYQACLCVLNWKGFWPKAREETELIVEPRKTDLSTPSFVIDLQQAKLDFMSGHLNW